MTWVCSLRTLGLFHINKHTVKVSAHAIGNMYNIHSLHACCNLVYLIYDNFRKRLRTDLIETKASNQGNHGEFKNNVQLVIRQSCYNIFSIGVRSWNQWWLAPISPIRNIRLQANDLNIFLIAKLCMNPFSRVLVCAFNVYPPWSPVCFSTGSG